MDKLESIVKTESSITKIITGELDEELESIVKTESSITDGSSDADYLMLESIVKTESSITRFVWEKRRKSLRVLLKQNLPLHGSD